jgi:hypothetical protein
MKRALIILPLLAVMAGVASAQMPQPPAASPVPPPRAEAPPARVTQTLVARQAPVPMLMTSRPPALAPVAAGADSATAETAPRQFNEADARAAIEADGYRKPRIVNKGADGTWHARALRGTIEVSLRVDAQGNVAGE